MFYLEVALRHHMYIHFSTFKNFSNFNVLSKRFDRNT